MPFLQDIIHRLEEGGGLRYFRVGLSVLVLLLVVGGYNWRAFRNMNSEEAMDAAQLARNISEGKGYTTLFVRPLSIYLVKKNHPGTGTDRARLKEMHPDLANPPVYPVVLAGAMKVLPFHYKLPTKPKPFWTSKGAFYRYQPDFLIALFNQFVFFGVLLLAFFLARRLFDSSVAWLSAILILGTELFWHFSVSGLSTILLMLIFMCLIWCLVLFEQEARMPRRGPGAEFGLVVLVGGLVGIGALTRYAFGWIIIPVLFFVILFGGPRRVLLALATLVIFAGVMAPWLIRNLHLSGTPFGIATYATLENTLLSPSDKLQRSLEPSFSNLKLMVFWIKLMSNLRQIVQSDLPKMGGSWISAFFLAGLMVNFVSPSLRRLRYFILFCLPVLAIVQALGRTQLSESSPEVNSENLLVLVAPVVLIYGVGFFFILLDQINLPMREMRYVVIGLFGVVASLPMLLIFLPPKTIPVMYPPYHPPAIQLIASWMKPSELTMSDVPWAVAWYGQRQCVWLTLKTGPDPSDPDTHEDFFSINDLQKPINALYLTPRTLDERFYSDWISTGNLSWGSFVIVSILRNEVPPNFPLHTMWRYWRGTGQFVLTDWQRWDLPNAQTPADGQK